MLELTPPSHLAYFVLGSNVEPERNLPAAVALLGELGHIEAVSPVYESPAVEVGKQPPYLNAAVCVATDSTPAQIFDDFVAFVERELGERSRAERRGQRLPRRIDVDLALYDDKAVDVGEHALPAPDILTRPYFAVPLADIAPETTHPTDGRTLAEIAASLDATTLELRDDVVLQPAAAVIESL